MARPEGDKPTAGWLRQMLPELAKATATGAAVVRAMPLPADPSRRGAAVEWPIAAAVSAAVWNDVPVWVRESFDGIAGDHGADALGPDPNDDDGLILWQFKWYVPGRAASYAARAQLESISRDATLRLGVRVSAAFGLRTGMRPCAFTSHAALECFHRAIPIVRYFDYADIGLDNPPDDSPNDNDHPDEYNRILVARERPAIASTIKIVTAAADTLASAAIVAAIATVNATAADAADAADIAVAAVDPRAKFQNEAIAVVNQKFNGGELLAFVVMATGTGKSRVAAGVAFGRTAPGGPPALVVAPRLEILGGLASAFSPDEWVVHRVGGGRLWPTAAALAVGDRRHVVVASAQSLDGHMPPGARFALVVRDEAHNGTGLAALSAQAGARAAPTLLLTATPSGNGLPADTPPPDYQLLFPRAALLALVCDPVFLFVGFASVPTAATLAADLLARPFQSVLVVYNSQDAARAMWAALEDNEPGVAGLLTSDYEPVRNSLGGFRAGAIRILVAVDKVGMGVDVPRCDAVVIAEPRGSAVDLAQLFGRACRLCPETKPDRKFTVVLPRSVEALADADACAAELADSLRIVFDGVAPAGVIRVEPANWQNRGGQVPDIGVAYEKIAERIFDSSARAVEPRAAQLRREYDRCRATIAVAAANAAAVPGRRTATAAWLAGLRRIFPDQLSALPDDPAGYFAELFGSSAKFPWPEYVGEAGPDVGEYLEFIRKLVGSGPGAAALIADRPTEILAAAREFGVPAGRDPLADALAMLGAGKKELPD